MRIDTAIDILAERTLQNMTDIRQKNLQRRHQVVDLYGVEYSRLGDASNPAIIYISISPDMEYIERFQFKLIITPFASSVGSMSSSGTGSIGSTSLDVEHEITITQTGTDEYDFDIQDPEVDPNPHTHSVSGITLTSTPGVTKTNVPSTAQFKVKVFDPVDDPSGANAVDISELLASQYNGRWIAGEGVYPSLQIDHDYDILQVACELEGLGLTRQRKLLTDPGYKGIMVEADCPFGVTLVNYLKYSHLNR